MNLSGPANQIGQSLLGEREESGVTWNRRTRRQAHNLPAAGIRKLADLQRSMEVSMRQNKRSLNKILNYFN